MPINCDTNVVSLALPGGGGGISWEFVGVCRPVLLILTLFDVLAQTHSNNFVKYPSGIYELRRHNINLLKPRYRRLKATSLQILEASFVK